MVGGDKEAKKKPVVLICCDWYEPGYKAGGPVQSVIHLAQAVSEVAEVYVLTSDRDLNEKKAYSKVPLNVWTPKPSGIRVMYVSPDKQGYRWYRRVMQEVNPDVLHLNSMWSLPFTLLPLLVTAGRKNVRKIVSPRGMLHEGSFRFKRLKKSFGLYLLQMLGLLKEVTFHATDESEQDAIWKRIPGAHTVVIPNLAGKVRFEVIPALKKEGEVKLIYVGRIAPQKNVHFILELMLALPDTYIVELSLVGLEDDEEYGRRCRKIVEQMPSHIRVSFLGALPHARISEKLIENHFLIQTSFSENFGHSVFEALSSGRPVIISQGIPWKNLDEMHAGFNISLNNRQECLYALEMACEMGQVEYDKYCNGALNYAVSSLNVLEIKKKYFCIFDL
jgi:glycosyltransferase involved in cell wall biosynthesis